MMFILPLVAFGFSIGKESKMATSKSKSIPALFQTCKRLRVDAGVNAARISPVEPSAESADETVKAASFTEKTRKLSTAAKASDAIDLHPLPGFEPPPLRGLQHGGAQQGNDSGLTVQETEETVLSQEKVLELSTEQRMRMELNKTVARAKRNMRTCEEHIAESRSHPESVLLREVAVVVQLVAELGKSFPEFQGLLVEQSWLDVLQGEFNNEYMSTLHTFVQQEAAGKLPIYPPPALVFNAFNTCPFDKVKVVIIGQDPYHGPGQAMGLSFSVPRGTKIPSSLVNIFKEIRDDVGSTIPSHGNLEKWAHQGVLMLNAVLTVRDHHANSHAKKGWEPFTDAAIRAVSREKQGIIFLLWGHSAHDKTRLIDAKKHHILKAAHPSGLSAHKGFFSCRHFSKTNQILEKAGELPIDWQL